MISIAVGILCSVLCLIFIIVTILCDTLKNRLTRVFVGGLFVNILLMLSGVLASYSIGKPGAMFYFASHVGYLGTFVVGYVLNMFLANYINLYLAAKTQTKRTAVYIVYAISGLGILTACISLANKMYFIIDENNIYNRQSMYWLAQVFAVVPIIISVSQGLKHRKHLTPIEKLVFFTYIMMPVVVAAIQVYVTGFMLMYIGPTLIVIIIYIGMQSQYLKTIKEKELELERGRTAIVVSQIQPHFIFNTLGTIAYLCDHDSKTAKETTIAFAGYLRNNLETLGNAALIPFTSELMHVKNYLQIEKLRFGDKLNVEYDLNAVDFLLPSLTLQSIVENAVRYGVTKRREGGMVKIATNETDADYVIVILDDGVGFNPDIVKEDGRTHIGISNVRSRVEMQTGGSLEVNSSENIGTQVTIVIPKRRAAK